MINFSKQLVFIVGGSEGIGLATARRLCGLAADVVILSRSEKKLAEAKAQLNRLHPAAKVTTASIDITNVENVQNVIKELVQKLGVPDVLINCAGIAHPGYLDEIEFRFIQDMMNVNVLGMVAVTRSLLADMKKKKRSFIVNVSSVAGYVGLFGYTGYCASKFAVIGFSEALRSECYGTGVEVSVLCPPNTRTPGLDRENMHKPAELLAMEEKVKVLDPEVVADYLLKNLGKNRFWIIPAFDSRMALYLKRFAPPVIARLTRAVKRESAVL